MKNLINIKEKKEKKKGQYVSDCPPSQDVAQGHFTVWTAHKLRLMHGRHKKYLVLSEFPYKGTSDAEQSIQPCKAGKAWEYSLLRPSVQWQF